MILMIGRPVCTFWRYLVARIQSAPETDLNTFSNWRRNIPTVKERT